MNVQSFEERLKESFKRVKDELDTHLDSINQNTSEIQEVYNVLNELDNKITKLTERLDEVQLLLTPSQQFEYDVELTLREQEVFLVLYTSINEISATDIAKRLGLTDDIAASYVFKLIGKGIPVNRAYRDNKHFFLLDPAFKDLQARKNILKIHETVSKELLKEQAL